jgi:GNAT superfamily N-acetyltransferase
MTHTLATIDHRTSAPPPYPTALINVLPGHQGKRLMLRPTLPQDRDALHAFYAGLTRDTLFRRFHCAFSHLSKERLISLSDLSKVDHQRVLMLVVTYAKGHSGHETVVAHAGWERVKPDSAEFALVVADAWQGHGLGRALLDALIMGAHQRQVNGLTATVLPGNEGMLHLARRRGFWLATNRDENGAIVVAGQVPRLLAQKPCSLSPSRPWWKRFGLVRIEGQA